MCLANDTQQACRLQCTFTTLGGRKRRGVNRSNIADFTCQCVWRPCGAQQNHCKEPSNSTFSYASWTCQHDTRGRWTTSNHGATVCHQFDPDDITDTYTSLQCDNGSRHQRGRLDENVDIAQCFEYSLRHRKRMRVARGGYSRVQKFDEDHGC